MCDFQVGQRVRIVSVNHPDNARRIGAEDVVTASYGVLSFVCGITEKAYRLAGDTCTAARGEPGFRAWASFQLEPVIPSGHRSGDYSYTELMDRLKAGEGVPA